MGSFCVREIYNQLVAKNIPWLFLFCIEHYWLTKSNLAVSLFMCFLQSLLKRDEENVTSPHFSSMKGKFGYWQKYQDSRLCAMEKYVFRLTKKNKIFELNNCIYVPEKY